jgi:cytochrome P450
VTTYDLTVITVTLFFAGPTFLPVYTITTFPSFYFSDQEWRKLRKLVSPAHSAGTVDVYFDVFKTNAEILVQTFMAKVGGGEFDVCPYLDLYTLASIIVSILNVT